MENASKIEIEPIYTPIFVVKISFGHFHTKIYQFLDHITPLELFYTLKTPIT